jgi:hypothetical protein
LISKTYEYNTTLTAIFLKIYGENILRCQYEDYSSLIRWQDNMDLLSAFTLCNLLSVTMHLLQCKKVSILMSNNVNPGPVPSR